MMDLEGSKQWPTDRTYGFGPLANRDQRALLRGAMTRAKRSRRGVVKPRTTQVESSSAIARTLERGITKIWVNPDNGFENLSNHRVATPEIVPAKLVAIVEAVAAYRETPRRA
jgi:hypothetical protein